MRLRSFLGGFLARISSLFSGHFLSILSSDFIAAHAVPTESIRDSPHLPHPCLRPWYCYRLFIWIVLFSQNTVYRLKYFDFCETQLTLCTSLINSVLTLYIYTVLFLLNIAYILYSLNSAIHYLNPLPDDNVLDWSKLQQIADNIFSKGI